jgi:hypothetical protein
MGLLDKKFNVLTALYVFLDKASAPASTTLSVTAAKGAATFTVTSPTGITSGKDIRVGSGETLELVRVDSVAGSVVTAVKPLQYAHASGEAVVEQEALNLGVPEADGFRIRYAGETTDIFSAVSRLAFGVLTGYVDLGASWRWPFVTTDAVAMALGIPRANVIGSGTAAQQTGTAGPRMFTTDGALFGTLQNCIVVATGTMNDGSHVKIDLWNVTFDPTAMSIQIARGQLTTVPCRTLASGGAIDFSAGAFTPASVVQTFAGSKADIPSEIQNVQTLVDSGTATTTTAIVAAGAYQIPVTSATGIVAGSIIRVGAGDNAELHIVHGIATLNVQLRTQVLRAHASGVAVVVQTPSELGIAQGGVTFALSGTVETQRSETRRVSLGYRSGSVAATLSCNLDAIKPETFYLAAGVPASEYANDVLPLGNSIASAAPIGVIMRGLTQGGKTFTLVGWNSALVVNGETQFTQAATALAPVSFKPSALQWLVNA